MRKLRNKIYKNMAKKFPFLRNLEKMKGVERALKYDQIFEIIEKYKCKKIMEIGTAKGIRALEMIRIAQKFHKAYQVEYFGFDIFEMMNKEIFKKEVSKQPLTLKDLQKKLDITDAKVKLFSGFTEQTMPSVISKLPKMDLVFIDGGHSIETIENDWKYTQKVMDKNTIVIFDDFWSGKWGQRKDAGCQNLVNKLDKSIYNVKILPIQDKFSKPEGTLKINFVQVQKI